jgi:hypothetical protein
VPGSLFDFTCERIEQVLAARPFIVEEAAAARRLGPALERLAAPMRTHIWSVGGRRIDLAAAIHDYDRASRAEGLHAMHDWDGKAARVNDDSIALDVLYHIACTRPDEPPSTVTLGIALDYHFFYVLALLSLRAWDEGDGNANLDRLQRTLDRLQGEEGSGQVFVSDAETLMLVATAHYEKNEVGYDNLLARCRSLDRAHQRRVVIGHAPALGSHLRCGFESFYGRDTVKMRDDNVADYPWLSYSLIVLMREWMRMREAAVEGLERDVVVEALANGLSCDAAAFVGNWTSSGSPYDREREEFRESFRVHRAELVDAFEMYRPTEQTYSPYGLFFNFSHNVVKGTVVDAMLWDEAWDVPLNQLFTTHPPENSEPRELLARTLMAHAKAHPEPTRRGPRAAIVYDPLLGRQAFSAAMRQIRGS